MRCGSDPLPAVDKGAVRNIRFLWKRNWFFLTAVCLLAELAVVDAITPLLGSAPCIDARETRLLKEGRMGTFFLYLFKEINFTQFSSIPSHLALHRSCSLWHTWSSSLLQQLFSTGLESRWQSAKTSPRAELTTVVVRRKFVCLFSLMSVDLNLTRGFLPVVVPWVSLEVPKELAQQKPNVFVRLQTIPPPLPDCLPLPSTSPPEKNISAFLWDHEKLILR